MLFPDFKRIYTAVFAGKVNIECNTVMYAN